MVSSLETSFQTFTAVTFSRSLFRGISAFSSASETYAWLDLNHDSPLLPIKEHLGRIGRVAGVIDSLQDEELRAEVGLNLPAHLWIHPTTAILHYIINDAEAVIVHI